MKTITDKKKIEELFARGKVVEVLPSREELMARLLSGDRLKIYIGFDPTAGALHLGHARNIMFLEELRQLGHEVIFLVGDFTAQVGDPSGRTAARVALSPEDVQKNMEEWIAQVKPIIDFTDPDNPARVMYNSTWLAELTFKEIVHIASHFTVQQMVERDMFEKRIKEGNPIHLNEFLYPLMQGYDSVAMDVDAELCGTDQIFNALAGRTLLKRLRNKEKFVIALNLLADPETGELMSKSRGTGVFIDLPPSELFGAIMAQPDSMIEVLFMHCTRIPIEEKDALMQQGPREAKARIAFDIVKRFHGEEKATMAEEEFNKTFSKGGVPEHVQEVQLSRGKSLADVLIVRGVIESKTEWRRLVDDGAVRRGDDTKISDPHFVPDTPTILKIGKRRFVKVVPAL